MRAILRAMLHRVSGPLVDLQRELQVRIQELSSTLEMLNEREVQRLLAHQHGCDGLCANGKKELDDEIGTFIDFLKGAFSRGFRCFRSFLC